jgi:acyl-CoA synthetase (AMP-forming)/AMP-acid ligase II
VARLGEISAGLPGAAGPLFVEEVPALRHVVLADDLAAGAEEVSPELVRALQAEVVPADLATVFFTSGTTAAPKAPVHDHGALVHQAGILADAFGLVAEDRWWGALPLFFSGGFVAGALATLAAGATVVLQAGTDPDRALELIRRERPTVLIGSNLVPALLEHPGFAETPIAFRKGMAGNTPIIAKLCPGDHVCVGTYGMSETATCVTSTRASDPVDVRRGSHGRPLVGVAIRIVDLATRTPVPPGADGEILVRGPSLMRSYYGMEPRDCFDEAGFFHTGDLGRVDADGSLHFAGRLREVIKSAGATVSPAEVEAALERHPRVHAACVVPAPDPVRGEVVVAFVVADPGVDEAVLRTHCRGELAAYKVPRHFFLRSEDPFPRTGTRKPDKLRLRAEAAALLGGAA